MSPRTFLFASLAIGLGLATVKLTYTANASSAVNEPLYSAIVRTVYGGSDIVDHGLTITDCIEMFVDRKADICERED